jgi:hypothetical protein
MCFLRLSLMYELNFTRSLHDMHEMKGHRAGHACPSVRLFTWLNSRTSWRIWMKFGMNIMPLGSTLKL